MENRSREEMRAARGRVAAHRALFKLRAVALRDRVSPHELKRDAALKLRRVADDTRAAAGATARAHPYAIGAGLLAVAAYALRRPIGRVAPRLGGWIADRYDAARERLSHDEGLLARNTRRLGRLMRRER